MAIVDENDKRITWVPLDVATTPRTGLWFVCVDWWWVVHPERGIMLWRGWSPQCNSDERITRHLQREMYPWAGVRQLPVAYYKERTD